MNIVINKEGEELNAIAIRHQGAGDLIKRQPDAKAVYIINHYDKESDSYSCSNYDDMNREIFIKSNKTVYVGFTF
jgi:hypothetical protein